MPSESITEKRDNLPRPAGWQPPPERAPSAMPQDEPQLARFAGMVGLCLVVLGLAIIVFSNIGWRSGLFGIGWATFFLELGSIGMLWHAGGDPDVASRRAYTVLGSALVIVGLIVPWVPYGTTAGGLFWLACVGLTLGLLFLLAALRHETEVELRVRILRGLGVVGGFLTLLAVVGSNIFPDFLTPRGFLLALYGLAYLWAFLSTLGTTSELGYQLGRLVAALGALTLVVALGRTLLPQLFWSFGWQSLPPAAYWKPTGLGLAALGTAYLLVGLLHSSDAPFAVLFRRELAAFFYSPVFHLVFAGLTLVAFLSFQKFLNAAISSDPRAMDGVMEPIVLHLFGDLIIIFCLVFVAPILTMRLFSEERRTGSLEVLLTAPVGETSVVLSKFFACLLCYMLIWLPWLLQLAAFRLVVQKEFDYYPVLAWLIAQVCMGSAFLSMGLFFSSLTRNQIVSAVLTFAGMLVLTCVVFLHQHIERLDSTSGWVMLLRHVSYIHLYFESLQGILVWRYLLFFVSLAVLWLFATVKVLEARRWS